jgi:hypothetical protein
MARELSHRHRGQTETGSWAACKLARLGEAVVVVLVAVSFMWPAAAGAANRGSAPDPSPQPAPTVTATSAPAPDPVPQAAQKAVATTPTQSTPSIHEPSSSSSTGTTSVSVAPTSGTSSTHVVASGGSDTVAAHSTPAPPAAVDVQAHLGTSVQNGGGSPPHRAAPRAAPRHVAAAHRPAPRIAPFPFTLSLPKTLFALPPAAFRAGVREHPDGVLLLLSSVAMAVLAVASFTLLRRLRRLEPR